MLPITLLHPLGSEIISISHRSCYAWYVIVTSTKQRYRVSLHILSWMIASHYINAPDTPFVHDIPRRLEGIIHPTLLEIEAISSMLNQKQHTILSDRHQGLP